MKKSLSVVAGLTAAAGILLTGGGAKAQDGADDDVLDVITVTARKREESILEAPVSITAFGRQQIEALGLQTIEDIQLFTPGFVFESFATTPGRFDQSPRFRGIDIDTGNPLRQTASVFVDGVFVVNGASGIGLNDVERVELIKGPQSAVFGRNTFGGAVNYITRTPGDDTRFDVMVSAAEMDDYEVSVGAEGALSETLAARVSAHYHDDGGHYDNAGEPGTKLGDEETFSVTGTLFFEPTERLNAKFRLNYYENDDGAPATVVAGLPLHNCGPFWDPDPGTPGSQGDTAICGDAPIVLPAGINTVQVQELYDVLDSRQPLNSTRTSVGFSRESLTASLILNFDINDNVTLAAISGYNDEETTILNDFDRTTDNQFMAVNDRQFEAFSQEVKLRGTAQSDRLFWSLGVNYFDQRFTNGGAFLTPAFGFSDNDEDIDEENIETLGVFGSIRYQLTDAFAVTAEGRYQTDDVETAADINFTPAGEVRTAEFTNFLPRIILEYQLTPTTLIYYSYSEGNQPGTFNNELFGLSEAEFQLVLAEEPLASLTLDEEELINNEIGLKHGFANGRGYVTSAVYFMERRNQAFRRSVITPDSTISFFTNAGKSDIQGFEVEANYQFTDMFGMQGSVGYTDAEYVRFNSGVHLEYFGEISAAGKQAPRFPEWSGSVSAMLDGDINSNTAWFGRVDLAYVGERFADEANLTTAPAGTIVNLRGGIERNNIRYELFVRNLTDEDAPDAINRTRDTSSATPLFDFSTFGYGIGLRDRRQIGFRLSAEF